MTATAGTTSRTGANGTTRSGAAAPAVNAKADAINSRALKNLDEESYTFYPEIIGEFPEKIFPVDEALVLKEGAQVMFVKNDLSAEKNYFNGKQSEKYSF